MLASVPWVTAAVTTVTVLDSCVPEGRSLVAAWVGNGEDQEEVACVASDGIVIPPYAKFVVGSWVLPATAPSSKTVAVKERSEQESANVSFHHIATWSK